jgi:O-antigen/teichoic acid export membrane protein
VKSVPRMEGMSPKVSDNKEYPRQAPPKGLPRSLRNVVSNWAGSLSSICIAFFLSPFVVHHLGITVYGVWVLTMSLTGYFGLLDLGVRGTVTCYIAKFHTLGKHAEASRLVSSAVVIFAILGTAAFGASVVLALLAARVVHVPASLKSSVQGVLILTGASVASTLISSVFGAVLAGLQRFQLANAIDIGISISRCVLILLALGHGKGLITLGIIQLTLSAVTGLVYAWASWRFYPQLSIRYMLADRANALLIFSFGSYLFLLNLSTYLILYTDSIVIGAFLPVAMVTFFAIAGNLISSSRSLLSGISTVLSPLASSLDADGKRGKIDQIVLTGPRYATMFILPIVITFVLRGKTFIALWMGSEYAGPSNKVLQVLSVALYFGAANQMATSIMIGINKHRPLVLVNIIEGILNLALSVVLVHSMGIVGVAWGTAIPNLITSFLFWPIYIRRLFGIPCLQYAVSTWVRPALAAVPFALMCLIIDKRWHVSSIWLFFFQVLLTLPVALLAFLFGCLSQTERSSFLGQISSPYVRVGETA